MSAKESLEGRGVEGAPRAGNLWPWMLHLAPGSSLRCPLSQARISQKNQCLTGVSCRNTGLQTGLCKHLSGRELQAQSPLLVGGARVHTPDSVGGWGALGSWGQREMGEDTVGFTGYPNLPGSPGDLRCNPTAMASSKGSQQGEGIGPP